MAGGYIKLWRSWLEHPIFRSAPVAWGRVALVVLLRCNWKPGRLGDGTAIPAGSFVTSEHQLATLARTSRQQARDGLRYLATVGFTTNKRTNRFTVISVTNWGIYQGDESSENQQKNQQRTNKEPTKEPTENQASNVNEIGPSVHVEHAQNEGKEPSKDHTKNHNRRRKKGRRQEARKEPLPLPPPQSQHSETAFSQNGDDDQQQEKPKPQYATERDELVDVIRDNTGELPDQKLVRQIEEFLELRGGTLRAYLDDIGPRLKRLKLQPTAAFFYSHAKNGANSRLAPKPQTIAPADQTKGKYPCCKGTGKTPSGAYCACKVGETWRDVERLQAEQARGLVQ